MAALYANENFPRLVVLGLRGYGHDVLTTAEAGEAGRAVPDTDVLSYATRHGRAVVTLNRRDFIRLHQESQAHGGIIVCTPDADTARQARLIHDAISAKASLAGCLVRVVRPSGPPS